MSPAVRTASGTKDVEIWNGSWLQENIEAGQARTKSNYCRTFEFVLKITVLKFSALVVIARATVPSATRVTARNNTNMIRNFKMGVFENDMSKLNTIE
jgi:hypothetical protein